MNGSSSGQSRHSVVAGRAGHPLLAQRSAKRPLLAAHGELAAFGRWEKADTGLLASYQRSAHAECRWLSTGGGKSGCCGSLGERLMAGSEKPRRVRVSPRMTARALGEYDRASARRRETTIREQNDP